MNHLIKYISIITITLPIMALPVICNADKEEGYFGKNPNDYIKPLQYLDQEISKEEKRLLELEKKEAARHGRVKSAKTDVKDKYNEVTKSSGEGLKDYFKGNKAGAGQNYIDGVQKYIEAKDRELQAVTDLSKTNRKEIRHSNQRIELLKNLEQEIEEGKDKARISQEEKLKKSKPTVKPKVISKKTSPPKRSPKKVEKFDERDRATRKNRKEVEGFKTKGGNYRTPF